MSWPDKARGVISESFRWKFIFNCKMGIILVRSWLSVIFRIKIFLHGVTEMIMISWKQWLSCSYSIRTIDQTSNAKGKIRAQFLFNCGETFMRQRTCPFFLIKRMHAACQCIPSWKYENRNAINEPASCRRKGCIAWILPDLAALPEGPKYCSGTFPGNKQQR